MGCSMDKEIGYTTTLDELREKFPEIPKNIILKTDILNLGIRYTPILSDIGKWTIPSGMSGYESETGKREGEKIETAGIEVPYVMCFRDNTFMQLILKENSPYEIRYEGDARFYLYREGEAIEEVIFPPRPKYMSKKTSDGTLISCILIPISDNWT